MSGVSGSGRQRDKPERPPAPPREANDARVTAVITVAWAIALAVLAILVATGTLPGHLRWWLWTCGAGIGFGLFGLWYVPVLKRNRQRAAQRAEEAQRAGEAGRDLQATPRRGRAPEPSPTQPDGGEARIGGPGGTTASG